ncbi:MAG: class I SAM-dependent methyltransferase [Dysgonamonadaceae bacterium]|jgi:2-polyprenyl-3-methyl-5-hydroxy-6-metoxy-1,4-benzoquinol methylase|nr:class I SAM-dependent methyltransferase [Dysgonamonadaceae bacterium]
MKAFQCPVCGNIVDESLLQCKDHSVSGEMFDICVCRNCLFAATLPQPTPDEIGKYYQTADYVSHSETTRGIVNKLYHIVRKKNTKDKLKLVNRLSTPGADLLDVGCGTGYFLSACKQDGWKVEGVELNDLARTTAETRISQSVFHSLDALAQTGKIFDVITLWHVFEHLFDINNTFRQLKHLLKPGGRLILALPNPTAADAGYYKEYWAAYDVPRHLSHFSPKSVALLVEKHRMEIQQTIPMKFDAFYVSMLSEGLRGRGKMSALLNGFRQGCRSNWIARKDGNYSSLIYVLIQNTF